MEDVEESIRAIEFLSKLDPKRYTCTRYLQTLMVSWERIGVKSERALVCVPGGVRARTPVNPHLSGGNV